MIKGWAPLSKQWGKNEMGCLCKIKWVLREHRLRKFLALSFLSSKFNGHILCRFLGINSTMNKIQNCAKWVSSNQVPFYQKKKTSVLVCQWVWLIKCGGPLWKSICEGGPFSKTIVWVIWFMFHWVKWQRKNKVK